MLLQVINVSDEAEDIRFFALCFKDIEDSAVEFLFSNCG